MKIAILCAALFCSTTVSAIETFPKIPVSITSAPTAAAFDFVRGHTLGQAYGVQWSMISNVGVERFEVQSTYEDPTDIYSNWYIIGNVNNSNAKIFKFTDHGALPGIINYRIVAVLTENRGTLVSDYFTTTIN